MNDRLAEVATWPLDRINAEGVVLVVWSEVLGRRVLFVPDGWKRREGEKRPAFAVTELRRLASIGRLSPAYLRKIAEVREIYDGTIESVQSAASSREKDSSA